MGDLLRTGLNNQKRENSVAVAQVLAADIATAAIVANPATGQRAVALNTALVADLPARSLVTNVRVNVLTASLVATETVDVSINGVVVGNEMVVGVLGLAAGVVTPAYFATGGEITIAPGLVPPTGTVMSIEVIIEFIELDVVEGTYMG